MNVVTNLLSRMMPDAASRKVVSGPSVFVGLCVALATGLNAAEVSEKSPPEDVIRESLAKVLPEVPVEAVRATPVSGLYEAEIGPRIVYISADGRYLVQGSIFDLEEKKNITEPRMQAVKAKAIAQVGEDKMIIFGPDAAAHTITVFTDIDCGYCRKLHSEIGKYNDAGIRVRYMMYPRAGLNSPSYKKAVSVWCSDDPKQALTKAKAGQDIEEKTCDNPVEQHMLLGELLGVTGTPAIFTETGEMLPGYVPSDRLKAYLSVR